MKRVIHTIAGALAALGVTTASAQSTYSDEVLQIALPGKWVREQNTDSSVWVSFLTPTHDAHFIVSVIGIRKSFANSDERLSAIEALASARRASIQSLANGTAQFTNPITYQKGAQFEYNFTGLSTNPKVGMQFRIVHKNDKVMTLAIYDYGGRDPKTFATFAEQCLSSVQLR